MAITPTTLLFMDFEASSLSANSWPIEVGLAALTPNGVVAQSRLIRPAPDWDRADWNPQSEAIHHIPLELLERDGLVAWDVAGWVLEQLPGTTLVSDAPQFDGRWLQRLLDCHPDTPPPGLRIHDYEAALATFLSAKGLDAAYEYIARHPAPHRAGPDAQILAQALATGLDVDTGTRPLRP